MKRSRRDYYEKDSENRKTDDPILLRKLLTDSGLQVPFDVNYIKLGRLGRMYVQNETRPLNIMIKLAEHAHCFFHSKSKI